MSSSPSGAHVYSAFRTDRGGDCCTWPSGFKELTHKILGWPKKPSHTPDAQVVRLNHWVFHQVHQIFRSCTCGRIEDIFYNTRTFYPEEGGLCRVDVCPRV
jgi:hypothetical protein